MWATPIFLGVSKTRVSADGPAGNFAAVRDADLRRTVALITAPTLVIVGASDPVTLAEHGRAIAETVPGARFLSLPAVHMANIECAAAFEQAVIGFLSAT